LAEAQSRATTHHYKIDPEFKNELMRVPGGETFKNCYQCGVCTATCPIARFTEVFRPNKIIHMAKLGIREVLKDDTVWLCVVCYSCREKCPQGVEVADVIRALKNMAVENGYVPAAFKEFAGNILKTGLAYNVPESRIARRSTLGLPQLPKTNLEDLKKLAEVTHLRKVIGE
jgi:heterodisulfide reductase subunit C